MNNYREEKRLEYFLDQVIGSYELNEVVKEKIKVLINRTINAQIDELLKKMEVEISFTRDNQDITAVSKFKLYDL